MTNPSPPTSYEAAYFKLTAAQVAEESKFVPFDVVIIGSGIGGGVLAASLLEKNRSLMRSGFNNKSTPMSTPDADLDGPQPLRILVVEKGGLLFHTHCLNGPSPSNSGTSSQGNDFFFKTFKHQVDIVDKTNRWAGGPVFCVGGRSAVWGLFAPRVDIDTLRSEFPPDVRDTLLGKYYAKAEAMMNIAYPTTLPPHQALIDRLNLRTDETLPFTQWQWGRITSEFRDKRNYSFAEGAFSTVDTLLENAMNDPVGKNDNDFRTVLNASVVRLEPAPKPNEQTQVRYVVVQSSDGSQEYKIRCNSAVICAGSVESPAILLRSVKGDLSKFGPGFAESFGHLTDHRIFAVTSPFFYRRMADRDVIGGMKLQTDIQFNIQRDGKTVDDTTALVNISLDGSSFLPRGDTPTADLPMLTIAYILPSKLAPENKIELNRQNQPRVTFDWAPDKYIEDKKQVMREFAVDIMKKVVEVFNVRFATRNGKAYTPILHTITPKDINLGEAGPGVVSHELGSIPMPGRDGKGILDANLQMQYGWNNVSVCDLSVFPYSPAANPTLTLSALALRLSDKLFNDLLYSPVRVFNLTSKDVIIFITNSRPERPSFGPEFPITISPGGQKRWRIAQREVMYLFSCEAAESYDVQMVYPGVDAMIVTSPPPAGANGNSKKHSDAYDRLVNGVRALSVA